MDDTINQLKDAAHDRWGDGWTIRQLHFADGSASAHAFRTRGKNEEGHLRRERLFVGADGEVYQDRVLIDDAAIVEVLERDFAEDEVRSEVIYQSDFD